VDFLLLVKLVYALVDMFLQTFCAHSTQDRAAKVHVMVLLTGKEISYESSLEEMCRLCYRSDEGDALCTVY